VDSVTLTDAGFNSTAVIPAGTAFFLRLDMAVEGPLAVLWPAAWNATVFLHRIDAAGQVTLGPTAFTWAFAAPTIVPLGPFATGAAAGAVPSGLWRVAIDLDPADAATATVVSAFIDGPVIEVT
jgi:hypothetical protein